MDPFRARASTAHRATDIDPSTQEGLSKAYGLGASECLMAAEMLDGGFSDLTGEYIVAFHALELGLKAFLVKRGFDAETLRKKPYGHDLEHLYAEAVNHGLVISYPNADKMISWVNEWHCDGVKFAMNLQHRANCPFV